MTAWQETIGGLRDAVRDLGAWNTALYVVDRVLRKSSGGRAYLVKYLLVAQPVPTEPVAMRASPNSPIYEVGQDAPVVASFPRPTEVIANRFFTGSVCYVAQVREKFAGFLWLAFNGYDEDEVRCRYEFVEPERSVWDYDVYVEPEYRLGRTFARLWGEANRRLAAEGVEWSYSRISAFNPASIAAHRRLGMEFLFSATFFCVGSFQLMVAGGRPFFHFGLSRLTRPVLRLSVRSRG